MKTTSDLKIHCLILAAVLGAGLSFVSPASAQQHSYIVDLNSKEVTDLGSLGGGTTEAYGINNLGQVVGGSRPTGGGPFATHAFITGASGEGMTDLGTLGGGYSEAYGINDTGQVTGWSSTAVGQGLIMLLSLAQMAQT